MGIWQHVDTQNGTGASAIITFSGLDGDTDKFYKIIGHGFSSSSTPFELKFNGATTNMAGQGRKGDGSSFDRITPASHYYQVSTGTQVYLEAMIFADKSATTKRMARCMANKGSNTSTDQVYWTVFEWDDTSTNLTSLTLEVDAGNWDTSSVFRLYKMTNA